MLSFLPSQDDHTIAVEFEGKATKEDAEKLDLQVNQKFGDKEKFNILAVMHDIEGTTLKGMTEGMKFDTKRWNQFRKFAVVSNKDWLETSAGIGSYLPGVTAEHFKKDQLDEAWQWIKN
ncbi:STAS/SEC14 domain-containing protein [Sediminibacillus massiliensis]|uniref:STAS/SEC14 domain-containing protein n=1 Tax=Sediminibacillus massiliensis TaxID=1926277 RepID=UPI0009884C8A|nr:STAS/SEC14 domain-containing protein [Sediminibacillus massiliensis]